MNLIKALKERNFKWPAPIDGNLVTHVGVINIKCKILKLNLFTCTPRKAFGNFDNGTQVELEIPNAHTLAFGDFIIVSSEEWKEACGEFEEEPLDDFIPTPVAIIEPLNQLPEDSPLLPLAFAHNRLASKYDEPTLNVDYMIAMRRVINELSVKVDDRTDHEKHMCDVLVALLRGETVSSKVRGSDWKEEPTGRDGLISTDHSVMYRIEPDFPEWFWENLDPKFESVEYDPDVYSDALMLRPTNKLVPAPVEIVKLSTLKNLGINVPNKAKTYFRPQTGSSLS